MEEIGRQLQTFFLMIFEPSRLVQHNLVLGLQKHFLFDVKEHVTYCRESVADVVCMFPHYNLGLKIYLDL